MEGLSVNEMALIICILGAFRDGERFYPTVEESLRYMKTGSWSAKKEEVATVDAHQLSFFLY